MEFSYHPKYEKIAKEVSSFLNENKGNNKDINFIVGGDGSLFAYADFNIPNFLICSHEFSKGHYASCFFEDNYKEKLFNFLNNPRIFEKKYTTLEVKINDKILPERAINDIMIGKDYCFKASVNGKKIHDTGFLCYTKNGYSGWAEHLGAENFEYGGYCFVNSKKSYSLDEKINIEILKYNESNLMIDGKGFNLDKNYVHYSTKKREDIYTKPWKLNEKDIVSISQGKPITIIKI